MTRHYVAYLARPRVDGAGFSFWVAVVVAIAVSWAMLGIAPAAQAQDRFIAFGDSITAGIGFDDGCISDCGYPRRLRNRIAAEGEPIPVLNFGLGGERTPEGLTRLAEVLAETNAGFGDALLLMEGTNDISRPELVSPETTLANLTEMGRLASLEGVETVHATLIPRFPEAMVDSSNALSAALGREIRDLAFSEGRQLVDPFVDFLEEADLFETFYSDPELFPTDPVGHPNADGFGLLAGTFFDALFGDDNVSPVLGFSEPANDAVGVGPLAQIRVRVYDFGDGIDTSSVSMTLNGEPVFIDTTSGGANWLDIVHQPVSPLPSSVRIRVVVSDLANPTNTLRSLATRFNVSSSGPDLCLPSENTLCIDHLPGDARFRVTMTWSTANNGGQTGLATVTPLAPLGFDNGGLLSFFPGTPEILIKVIDACGFNDRFWVFGAPTTTLGYELKVEDLIAKSQGESTSGFTFTVTNIDGTTAPSFADTDAFNTCNFN